MQPLDAGSLSPLDLVAELSRRVTEDPGWCLVDHGRDISPRRLRAAQVSLARALVTRVRQLQGRRLAIARAWEGSLEDALKEHVPSEGVLVLGLIPARAQAAGGLDPTRYQSLWIGSRHAVPELRRPVSALLLLPGDRVEGPVDLTPFLSIP